MRYFKKLPRKHKKAFKAASVRCANWWANKAFKTENNQDNGDNSISGALGMGLANMLAEKSREGVTRSKITIFTNSIINDIWKEKQENINAWIMMDVDYHPCKILTDACHLSGLDSLCLPIKTWTKIRKDNKVSASFGYRGKIERV